MLYQCPDCNGALYSDQMMDHHVCMNCKLGWDVTLSVDYSPVS